MGCRSNSYLLDGANMRGYAGTATVSAAETTLGVETIREFRVVTNAYSADYGRAMGGVISLVTKSGHERPPRLGVRVLPQQQDGRAQLLRRRRPAAVHAPSVRRRRAAGRSAEQALLLRRRRTAAGRPRHHDRDHRAERRGARRRVRPGQSGRPAVPRSVSAARTARDLGNGIGRVLATSLNQPTRENFYQGRVDYSCRATRIRCSSAITVRRRRPVGSTTGFPQFGTDSVSRNQFFTAEYKRIVTPALLNTARFSHSRLEFEQLPTRPLDAGARVHRRTGPSSGVHRRRRPDGARRQRDQPVHQQQLTTGPSATTSRTRRAGTC